MARPGQIAPTAVDVLAYLHQLDAGCWGYSRRGVSGWAMRADVEASLSRSIPEILPTLHRRSLVDCEDVRAPKSRSALIYRITAAGAVALANERGRGTRHAVCPPHQPGPADVAVFIPKGPRVALEILRRAVEDPTRYYLGERGWRTEGELIDTLMPDLVRWVEGRIEWAEGDEAWKGQAPLALPSMFGPSHLRWLRQVGFAQSWGETPPGHKRIRLLWRVTSIGAVVIPLEWHSPEEGGDTSTS